MTFDIHAALAAQYACYHMVLVLKPERFRRA